MTVDIYAKGLSAGQVTSRFEPHHVTVAIADPSGGQEEYKLDVDTYGPIVPEGCRVEVLKTKVEVVLAKGDNKQWATLEKSDKVAAAAYAAPAPAAAADAGAAASSSASAGGQRPQYPTSHRKAKNWDEVEKEVKELEASGQLEDGDPLNNFFKKIFSQGDDDQRRAMMKSFVESNGTVLSTNWSEVGSKKVECTPPENAVVKKWNE